VVEVAQQQVVDVVGAHVPAHGCGRVVHHLVGLLVVVVGCLGGVVEAVQQRRAPIAAYLDQEPVAVVVQEFGQHQVVARSDPGAGPHGRAEAGGGRRAAVDRDDQRLLAARLVGGVGVLAHEHAVLDADGRQVAASHGEEGEGAVVRWGAWMSNPSSVRCPRHSSVRGGNRYRFHECGPTAYPNSASSSRSTSR
jgi:hypothetical protein